MTRFFRIAEDISSEQMQSLWGRILAGEVRRPGSFALRTLDILRNIGQHDAEVFTRLARFRISTNDKESFLIDPDNGKYLQEHCAISFSDVLLLRELDLVVASDMLAMTVTTNPEMATLLRFGTRGLIVESTESVELPNLRIIGFTSSGHQLAQLVLPEPTDEYIRKVGSLLKHDKVSIKVGTIAAHFEGRVQLAGVQPFTDL